MMTYLAESLGLGVLLETKGWEVDTCPEHLCFRKNANASYSVQFHLHVRVSVRVTEVGQVRPPCGVFGVTFNNDCVLV
jgi:hypothetical protein